MARSYAIRWLALAIVAVFSFWSSAALAQQCTGSTQDLFEKLRKLQPRAANFDTSIIAGGGTARLTIDRKAEPGKDWLFAGGYIAEPANSIEEDIPSRSRPLSVLSVATDERGKLVLTVAVPPLFFELWPRYRFFVAACEGGTIAFTSVVGAKVSPSLWSKVFAVGLASSLYLAVMTVVIKRRKLKDTWWLGPVALTAGFSGRGSLSKLQILFFTLIVLGLLAYMLLRTGLLSDLSEDILLLLGITGAGTAAAKQVSIFRRRLSYENWIWLKERGWQPPNKPRPTWGDLVTSGGVSPKAYSEFDIYKFQMLAFSLIVGISLIFTGLTDLSQYSIPPALIGVLGLSQVIYVGGKTIQSPEIDDLDKAINDLKDKGEKYVAAKAKETPDPDAVRPAQQAYESAAEIVVAMVQTVLGGKPLEKIALPKVPSFPVPAEDPEGGKDG